MYRFHAKREKEQKEKKALKLNKDATSKYHHVFRVIMFLCVFVFVCYYQKREVGAQKKCGGGEDFHSQRAINKGAKQITEGDDALDVTLIIAPPKSMSFA